MNDDVFKIDSIGLYANHLFNHRTRLQEYLKHTTGKDTSPIERLNSLISDICSTDDCEKKLNEIAAILNTIQEQPLTFPADKSTKYLSNEIECLREDVLKMTHAANIPSRITHKIQFSNNAVRWIRGPIKVIFNGTMHVFDTLAKHTHMNSSVVRAVAHGLTKKSQTTTIKQSAFIKITSEWTYIGKNRDQGFNSESIWMLDPQGRRILVKTQENPLCAANEWLTYVLGSALDLPVNEVQITVYQNKLVTLHTDVNQGNERTMTFMELPKQVRKHLLTHPILGRMDLLDHIIQNSDRNLRNLLVTISNTADINDPNVKMKIHLIDHASCFGLGKLSIVSLVAFEQARKLKLYLESLPVTDRSSISHTLNNFAQITNGQFTDWLNEIRDLLSENQYNRILDVLIRQRDVVNHPPDINEDSCSDIVAILVFNNEHIWSVKKYENDWYSLDSLSEEPQTIPFRRIFARQGCGWIIIRNHSGLRVNDESEEHTIVNMTNKKTSGVIADQSPKLKRRRRRV
ncbi:unnamed protein product [Adineta ricciae]|uniref:Uncharacterized protein n=1 Tax=Adineta ricciae TaxID=249248 RepID=A0A815NVI8_ADIRI|nr:unnamed protein product [Adineta ricciae]CAF1518401.1 unnamed protein product [Adineta ricciae]